MKLTDLYTIEEWERVLGVYKTLLGIAPITFDEKGQPLTEPIFTSEACRMIKGTDAGAGRCKADHLRMVEQARNIKDVYIGECHAGFIKIVLPIYYEEELLGVTGGCNVFREGHAIDEQFYLTLARELGLNGPGFLEGVKMSRKVTDKIIEQQIVTLKMKISARMKRIDIQQKRADLSFFDKLKLLKMNNVK